MDQAAQIVIKKYPNRRLYNTSTSSYIKLADLAEMVKKDQRFTVIDVKSKEDITRITLVQIILEHEMKGYELMPENLIKTIIKFYDHPANTTMQNYFAMAVRNFNGSLINNPALDQAFNICGEFEKITSGNLTYFNQLFFGINKENGK